MHISLQTHEIVNFRGVTRKVTLDFTKLLPGLYFVEGRNVKGRRLGSNGAGKSTFFSESFLWLLQGRLSQSQRPGAHVENWDADGAITSVRTGIALDGVLRHVERTRNVNNLTIDDGKVDQAELDRFLPLSEAALRRSIFIDQFADMFLSLKPEEKSRIFSETLDLDRWLTASDRASERLASVKRYIIEHNTDLATIKGQLEVADSQLEQVEASEKGWAADKKQRLAEANARAAEAIEDHDEAFAALNAARADNATVDGASARTEANDLIAMLRGYRSTVSQMEGERTALRRKITDLQAERLRYDDAFQHTGKCPECGQDVSDKHLQDKLKRVKRSITIEKNTLENQEARLGEAYIVVTQTEDRIRLLEESLETFNAKQAVVSVAAERSIAATRRMHAAKDAADRIKAETNPYTKQGDDLEALIKDRKKDQAEIETKLETAAARQEMCEFWQKGFKEIRLNQIDDTLLELELATNNHAEALGLEDWFVEFNTERETKRGTISHGFSVMLYPPGHKEEPVPFEIYSGGEGQRWQLAVTFGLADVLLDRAGISTDFEIIDEPTHHLSAEGIDDLLVCLKERAEKTGRRIFLIDQHLLNKGAFDGIITVVKDKHGSYVEDDGSGFVIREKRRERVSL